jgi:chromosome segregation ATPase
VLRLTEPRSFGCGSTALCPSVVSIALSKMNRFLQYLNLLGVAALALLCGVQWRTNRQVNLEATGLMKAGFEQAAKLEDQDKSLKSCAVDLEGFREQLSRAHNILKVTETKAAVAEREIRQLSSERDQLKTSGTNWAAAVSTRDDQLKAANEQLHKLAEGRNETIANFNELARKYNAVVQDLNEARTKLASMAAVPTNGTK